MPGSYAHITLANLMNQPDIKDSIPLLSDANKLWIGQRLHFCELGAVSPDYPYLAVQDGSTKAWADKMHYVRTGQMIQSGMRLLPDFKGEAFEKAFVWLLGYASHVIADVTVHPVIQMKVGEYQTHQTQHRICEMNQDAYIYFNRLNRSGVDIAEHLNSGIALCGDPRNHDNLDGDISAFWLAMLKDVYPNDFAATPPHPNEWHKGFRRIVGLASRLSGSLIPFARHVADGLGLVYPPVEEVDQQYIRGLDTPRGLMDYDQIFDIAIDNVKIVWGLMADGIFHQGMAYQSLILDWNLDTGLDQNDQLGFWSGTI